MSTSREEKIIISEIVSEEGARGFAGIFTKVSRIDDGVSIFLPPGSDRISIHIDQRVFTEDASNHTVPENLKRLVTEDLVNVLYIIDNLHSDKLINLYHPPNYNPNDPIEISVGNEGQNAIANILLDENLIKLLRKYTGLELLSTPELKRFCERDYKSEEEARFEEQNKNAKRALMLAIASPIFISGVNIYLKPSSQYEVPQMVNSIESAILKGSTVNYSAQIDRLGNNIDQIANEMTAISDIYNAKIPTESLEPLSSHELVIRIQKSLNMLGYKAGEEDGILGKNTIRAIREFQINNQEEVSGIPSHSLLKNLQSQIES
ncbi:peptidoglycan-binding domain-containing protein [Microbulbifer sp. SSSA005]|uniref:peptidoglycan-binding domain-containing protein n=1 Tax=Microbulbifer sp. SSSA005 TaxID=3243378 RepID=UPI00403A728E